MKSVKLLCLAIVTVPVIAGSQQNVTPSMTVISAVAPVYPGVALALRHGGKAVIEVTVNPQGNVVDAKPLEGSRLL